MLTLQDCIAFSGLSEEEIRAIAEHEHIPETVATTLGSYLAQTSDGEVEIRNMIIDDIRHSQKCGNKQHVRELLHVLHHYLRGHPSAIPFDHPWSEQR